MNRFTLPKLKQLLHTCLLFLLIGSLFVFSTRHIYAAEYGRGEFNQGNYGEGSSTSTSDGSSLSNNNTSTSAPTCNDSVPGNKVPWLYGAVAQDGSSITLYFTEADTPVDHYVLQYGTKSGEYQYGIQDLGVNERHQMTFLVQSLLPNTTYYFQIRGGNGCATGQWSNEISASSKNIFSFNQLKMSTELVNKEATTQSDTADEEETPTAPEKYNIHIKVLDMEQKPVENAEVTLHSTPRKGFTNSEGVTSFNDVEAGDHKLYIASDGYEGEQSINLGGDSKDVEIKVTIERKSVLVDSTVLIALGTLYFVIIGVIVWFVSSRKK